VEVRVVDTALRLRRPQSTSTIRRLLAGPAEALWILLRCAWVAVVHRPDVLHLNVSGGLGLFRDLGVAGLCRLLRMPLVVHLRFGRIPEIADTGSWEWRLLSRLLPAASAVVAIDARTARAVSE
jgi:hypothetical protein